MIHKVVYVPFSYAVVDAKVEQLPLWITFWDSLQQECNSDAWC